MSTKYRFYRDGNEIDEADAVNDDGTLKDGVTAQLPVFMRDSAGHKLVDAAGQPLPAGSGKTGWAFADADRTISRENSDLHRAMLSATWKDGLEAGDLVQINGRMMQVRGYDSNEKIHLSDADAVDADELKQNAYDAMTRELSNAWRGKAVAGDEEGGACVVGDRPGRWTKGANGKLVCTPISKEPSDNEHELAGPLSDQQAADIKRAAWEQSVRDLQDAWRR